MKKIIYFLMLEYFGIFFLQFIDDTLMFYYFFACWSFLNLLIIPPLLIKKTFIRRLYLSLWSVFFVAQMFLFILNQFWPSGEIPSELFLLFTVHSVPAIFNYHLKWVLLILFGAVFFTLVYRYAQKKGQSVLNVFSKKVFIIFSLLNILALGYSTYIYNAKFMKNPLSVFASMEKVDFSEYNKYGAHFPFTTSADKIVAEGNRNLIYIILESVEKNFIDNELFPGLCPSLQKFAKNGIVAENMSMSHNSTLTFGGMYAAFSGKWLSSYSRDDYVFLKAEGNSVTFPLILQKAGYEQVFIYGHKNAFGGCHEYLEKQGFKVKRFGDYIKGAEPDSRVFSIALQEFKRLSKLDKPFNIMLLTVNTHAPEGFLAEDVEVLEYSAPELKKNRLLDIMHTTDAALGHFLDEVAKSPVFENTTIVIQSDHLAHPNTIKPVMERLSMKPRNMLFMILNSVIDKDMPAPAMTFDIAPTVLSAMGVKHNAVFLFGEDLFQDEINPRRLIYSNKQEKINSYYYNLFEIKKIALINDENKYYLQIGDDKIPMIDDGDQKLYDNEANTWCMLPVSVLNTYTSVINCRNDGFDKLPYFNQPYILYGSTGDEGHDLSNIHLNIKIPPHSSFLIYKKNSKDVIYHIVPFGEQPHIEL